MKSKFRQLHPCVQINRFKRALLRFEQWLLTPGYFEREQGLATAEYAIVAIAATAFAGVLIVILRSDAVREMLENIFHQALSPFVS
jgi:hypothetical protein